MNDVLHALGMSAGILLLVVVVTIFVSMAAVNRGAIAHAEAESHAADESLPAKEPAAAASAAKAVKPAAGDEINVPMILALGTALFVLSIAALMLLSLIEHLG
jgi:hypothetical protein